LSDSAGTDPGEARRVGRRGVNSWNESLRFRGDTAGDESNEVVRSWHNELGAGGVLNMPVLDWSQCPAVESIPGKVSGAWVFKDTRTPVAVIFENLEDGMTIDEVIEQFPVTRDQIRAVLEFAARSLDAPVTAR
jgi:uncharacterized protein (DUF433 family)